MPKTIKQLDRDIKEALTRTVFLVWHSPGGWHVYYRGSMESALDNARALAQAGRTEDRNGYQLVERDWTMHRAAATPLQPEIAARAVAALGSSQGPADRFELEPIQGKRA